MDKHDKHMETFIGLGIALSRLFKVRKGQHLNELFNANAQDALRDCLGKLRVARGRDDMGAFSMVVQNDFLEFLHLIETPSGIFRDSVQSLQDMYGILSKMSDLCQIGVFGKDAFDVCPKIQSIKGWLRGAETYLTHIAQLPKP